MAGEQLAFLLLGVIAISQALIVPDPVPVAPVTYPKYCGGICRKYCPFGFVQDRYGCPICQCRDSPYQCPPVTCYNQCPYGYIYRNGCQTCDCNIVARA